MHKPPAMRSIIALAAAGTVLTATLAPGVLAQTVQPPIVNTASPSLGNLDASPAASGLSTTLGQTQTLTVAQTEGPYFKTNSPERNSLLSDGMAGTVLTLTGQVLAPDGTAVAGALLDFWQADPNGTYDSSGYTLRGHQYTDANGNYTLTTVAPGLYPGRTRHIHVKVQAPNGPLLTTQLYFTGEARNTTDRIFDPSLVLDQQPDGDATENATFNFVVEV